MQPIAFKEWAVICSALAEGRQALILRKGGIAETGGTFRPDHDEFLLYPTFFHEHGNGVKPEEQRRFDTLEKPPAGQVRFAHLARVEAVQHVADLGTALRLDPLHVWMPEVVRQRFAYRTPGLFVLTVRVYRLAEVALRVERPEYAGCKTWVELDEPVPAVGAAAVMTDDEFTVYRARVATLVRG